LLGDTLAFSVDAGGLEGIGTAEIVFGDVRDVLRLAAIDGPRAGKEELAGICGTGEIEDALGAVDDGSEHLERLLGGQFRTGLGGGMNDVGKLIGRQIEAANVTGYEGEGGISCEMWALG